MTIATAKKLDGSSSFVSAWDLFHAGDFDDAKAVFSAVPKDAAVDLRAEALFGLGKIAEKKNKVIEATKNYIDALRYNRGYVDVYLALGDLYIANGGQALPALECYGQAVAYEPERYESRQRLVSILSNFKFEALNSDFKGVLTACLEHEDQNLTFFGETWKSILMQDKKFLSVWNVSKNSDYADYSKAFSQIEDFNALLDPFFLYGLGKFIVCGREFERWIVNLRRYLLDLYKRGQYLFVDNDENEYVYCALSRYASYSDYILNETEDEAAFISDLQKKIESGDVTTLQELALYAMYRPLFALKNAQQIEKNLGDIPDHVSQILKKQIAEYYEQQDIKRDIVSLAEMEDVISQSVREQYEEFPYPRWGGLLKNLGQHKIEARFNDKKVKVLIAGCGTGQEALEIAGSFPQAEVLAVDLSKSSLAFAIMRSRQLGIENITFKQADIMTLGDYLKPEYDFIASSGVLHHMKDPKAGWQVLHGLLKPKGLLRIALYSNAARSAVNESRAVIAEKKLGNDTASIRAFRDAIDQNLSVKSIKYLERFIEYNSLPMVRDLLFHVQEHQFNLLQIKSIIDEMELKFLGFDLKENVFKAYKKFAKKDPEFLDLEQWSKFEQKNPDTFIGMYTFWCEKKA